MRNKGWFYKGVRYAKDGRYACYCNTPEKKRTVLLKDAVCTLEMGSSYRGGPRITPFNVDSKELIVTYPEDNSIKAQEFTDSNYFIMWSASTGQYYCYVIDYITPYDQMNGDNIKAFPNNVTFRVGISLDIWQTHFFKMRTKFTTAGAQPKEVAPHSTESDTANEVVMPKFDFANIQRTNMNAVLGHFGNIKEPNHFRNILINKTYNVQIKTRRLNLVELCTPATARHGIALIMKLNVAWASGGAEKEVRGALWVRVFANELELQGTTLLTYKWGEMRRIIENHLVSSGTIITDYLFPQNIYGPDAGHLNEQQRYTVEAAYAIPATWADKFTPNVGLVEFPITLKPTNWAGLLYATPIPLAQLTAGGVNSDTTPTGNTGNIKTNAPQIEYTEGDIRTALYSMYPQNTEYETLYPFLTVGVNDQTIALVPAVNAVKQSNELIAPAFDYDVDDPVLITVRMELTIYNIKFVISNGSSEIDITECYRVPLREITDLEEIERQKSSRELGNIAQGISLLNTTMFTGTALMSQNPLGAVSGTAAIAQGAIQLTDSIINAPDYEKMKKSVTLNPPLETQALISPLTLYVPENWNTGDIQVSKTYYEEFTEIGIELGCAVTRESDFANVFLDNSAAQNVGFIEVGAVIQGLAQDAGEWCEQRFRLGVTFYYA